MKVLKLDKRFVGYSDGYKFALEFRRMEKTRKDIVQILTDMYGTAVSRSTVPPTTMGPRWTKNPNWWMHPHTGKLWRVCLKNEADVSMLLLKL